LLTLNGSHINVIDT